MPLFSSFVQVPSELEGLPSGSLPFWGLNPAVDVCLSDFVYGCFEYHRNTSQVAVYCRLSQEPDEASAPGTGTRYCVLVCQRYEAFQPPGPTVNRTWTVQLENCPESGDRLPAQVGTRAFDAHHDPRGWLLLGFFGVGVPAAAGETDPPVSFGYFGWSDPSLLIIYSGYPDSFSWQRSDLNFDLNKKQAHNLLSLLLFLNFDGPQKTAIPSRRHYNLVRRGIESHPSFNRTMWHHETLISDRRNISRDRSSDLPTA